MANTDLSTKEFLTQYCRWADKIRIETGQKDWDAMREVIVRNLFLKKRCKVPDLGTFELILQKEYYQKQIIKGEEVYYKVPERYSIKFTPHDNFIDDVNGKGVTKSFRRREKEGALTKKDIEREKRFEAMKNGPTVDGMDKGLAGLTATMSKVKKRKEVGGSGGKRKK